MQDYSGGVDSFFDEEQRMNKVVNTSDFYHTVGSARIEQIKKYSATGNRTPVSRVTGGDTHHYTIVELLKSILKLNKIRFKLFINTHNLSDIRFEVRRQVLSVGPFVSGQFLLTSG